MTKAEMIDRVASGADVKKVVAARVLEALTAQAVLLLSDGQAVVIPGMGLLKVLDTPAREGRNPQTGEPLQIPAGKRFKFVPTALLKDAAAQAEGK